MKVRTLVCALMACATVPAVAVLAQRTDVFGSSIEHPAIDYPNGPVDNVAATLNRALADGQARLTFDPEVGYLRSVLSALDVPVESQVLVYSQTSSQANRISSKTPRAIYFNDRVSVGWVPEGEVLEIAAQDRQQGTIFYTLAQAAADEPRLARDNLCLRCHLSWDTRGVPGPFVMSTHPRKSESEYANGGVVDDREPLSRRWGGWYVTGAAVPDRHMGNTEMLRPDATDPEHTPPPPKYTSLEKRFDTGRYLTPFSDVVALLVLEHQAHLMNLITWTGWEDRVAGTAPAIFREPGSSALAPRVAGAVEELVDYMLFVDEAPLPERVAGSSGFAKHFEAQGPRDEEGRSLRDLDLHQRLMRYPLSYVIYTPAFDGLPDRARNAVYERLWRILSEGSAEPHYAHLTRAKRQAIVEILRATKPGLPAYFTNIAK